MARLLYIALIVERNIYLLPQRMRHLALTSAQEEGKDRENAHNPIPDGIGCCM